jgi:predicted LPLAT superfamily acyltransferase
MLASILFALLSRFQHTALACAAAEIAHTPWEIAHEVRCDVWACDTGAQERALVAEAVADWRKTLSRRERALLALDAAASAVGRYAWRCQRSAWYLGRSPAQLDAVLAQTADDIPF